MRQLEIDRKRWVNRDNRDANGSGPNKCTLLNDVGNMCCLGFKALHLDGYEPSDILHVGTPSEIEGYHSNKRLDTFEGEAIRLNDARDVATEDREPLLIKLFATEGIELTFTS